ncbi:MAG: protein translocase subunit SecF [Candidatus Pacebacteria bacterium]|nr:protein translocase subunit SecF [Candidatus Paceibacterota bacterium]
MYIIKHTKIFLTIAAIVMTVSVGIVAVVGLKPGIDFAGGALTEVAYDVRPEKAALEVTLDAYAAAVDLGSYSLRATVDDTGRDGYILRTRALSEDERIAVEARMLGEGEGATLGRFTSIGPVIGAELKDKAVWAIGAVVLVIIMYVAFAFRSVSKPMGSWVYGGITIFALVHDVLVPTAFMSVWGYFTGAEVDVLFITALLAVLGYSVNDTIVVFDRVRENLLLQKENKKQDAFDDVVGLSVEQTITRSINTSVTTLLALGALFLLGGEVTQNFALVLMVGVLAGTYSSICIANPMLTVAAKHYIAKAKAEQDKEASK